MEMLVLNREVSKGDNFEIRIQLNSELESSIVDRFELDILTFLRKVLCNDFITLERVISEDKQEKKIYTSKDKFEYLVEQNPKLKEMKERFGLDFDY
jgi:DNA polymerase-3 subunit gamma/tau